MKTVCASLFVLFVCTTWSTASASSALSYNAVLTMVILELTFAFSIGVMCIIFSLNLYRALKNESDTAEIAPPGEYYNKIDRFAANDGADKANLKGVYNAVPSNGNDDAEVAVSPSDLDDCASDDYELEYRSPKRAPIERTNSGFSSAIKTFTNYMRPW